MWVTGLHHFWNDVWPNLAAAVIWQPMVFIHVTRSNKKHMRIVFGEQEDSGT